ncbi:MAG: hypothetical protein QG608_589 [Actinomycetota bacterium]|nr:hypothetical protein [Actinomycetota bacterium]
MKKSTVQDEALKTASAIEELTWQMRRAVPIGHDEEPLSGSHLGVLRVVLSQPGLTVSQAADRLGMRLSNISTTLTALETKGLVSKTLDPGDRRIVRLMPTDAAEQALHRIEDRLAQMIAQLPDKLREQLLAATPALYALTDVVHATWSQHSHCP